MAYRVYSYGITSIDSGEAELCEQLRQRTRYWNALVEVEKRFQERKEAVLREGSAAVAAAQSVVDAAEFNLEAALRAQAEARKAGRTKQTPVQVAAVQEARRVRRGAFAAFREVRRVAFGDEGVKAALDVAELHRQEEVRQARAATALYWGSYLDVENAYRAHRKTKGAQLRFHRSEPTGACSVWLLSGGMPVGKAWGGSSMIQLDPVPEDAWQSPVRSERRKFARTTGRLRVGTGPGKQPVYVEFHVVVHRPLPPEGIIRHASIVRRRVASHYQHTLTVTVEVADAAPMEQRRLTAALDVGWRVMGNRVRIGYLVDEAGEREELSIDGRIMTALQKCDAIRAVRDQRFNWERGDMAVRMTMGWMGEGEAPEWLKQATATLGQWRSPARLAGLALRWQEQRFAGDAAAYAAVEAWRKRDKHLWEYEANLRQKAIARRREEFRCIARRLVKRYGVLVLEEFDISKLAEDDTLRGQQQRHYTAVGEFRVILAQVAAREGVTVEKVPAAFTTVVCHRCERQCDFDAGKELSHVCEHCGWEWDQDENAARNLLKEWQLGGPLAIRA